MIQVSWIPPGLDPIICHIINTLCQRVYICYCCFSRHLFIPHTVPWPVLWFANAVDDHHSVALHETICIHFFYGITNVPFVGSFQFRDNDRLANLETLELRYKGPNLVFGHDKYFVSDFFCNVATPDVPNGY